MSLSEQQLALRKTAIFSTDAAPALGLSKYRTPVQVWLEKTGQAPDAPEPSEAMKMGLLLQPVIASLYEQRMGVKVRDLEGVSLIHRDIPFIGSSFDYEAPGKRLVEVKNFHPMRQKEFGEDGSADVPMDVLIQCVVEGMVWGTDNVDVAVLFGGQSFKVFPILIDADTKNAVTTRLEEFWKRVVERKAPDPVTPEETRRLFPKDIGVTVMAHNDTAQNVRNLIQVREQIKSLEKIQGGLEAQIQAAMASASTLVSPQGEVLATWKNYKTTRLDTKRLKEERPEIYENYGNESEGRRFLVKG